MKKTILSVLAIFFFASGVSCAASRDQDANLDQAKRDYKLFLEQLKEINKQYLEVSDQIRDVVKDEGMPTWDTGPDLIGPGDKPSGTFGGTDIKDNDKEMIVTMDLPGTAKDSIRVSVEGGKVLRVKAERESQKEESSDSGSGQYYRVERQHGSFERVIELPSAVSDSAQPDAHYDNGVLTVKIPKERSSKKQIAVPVR